MSNGALTSKDHVLDALLDLTFKTLETALAEEPKIDGVEAEERETRRQKRKNRRKNQGEEPFSGRWWKKTVPGTKRWIPYILKYIEKGAINVGFYDLPVWDGDLTAIVPTDKGLTFAFEQQFLGGPKINAERKLSYPNAKVADICQGKRTFIVGNCWIQVDPKGLLFDTKLLEDGTGYISWKGISVGYDGWAFFDVDATLEGIEFGKDEGEVILSGWKGALTPRLIWSE